MLKPFAVFKMLGLNPAIRKFCRTNFSVSLTEEQENQYDQ